MRSDWARIIKNLLDGSGLTISTAESCTAGGISAVIASVDGASVYFLGGVVSYATNLKTGILGVPEELIERCGVVSKETAVAMNEGVRRLTHSDVAVSVTGYVGASGGDDFVPNGTVWICVGSDANTVTREMHVSSDRTANIQSVIDTALALTVEFISSQKK